MVSKPLAGIGIAAVVATGAALLIWLGSDPGLSEGTRGAPAPAGGSTSGGTSSNGAVAGGPAATDPASADAGIPTISTADSNLALCQVRSAAITSLLAGTRGPARYEALRDAVPALGERLQEVQDAAHGRPALTPVITTVQRVYTDWSTALTSYDAGRTSASAKALRSASTRIAGLDSTLRTALPASVKCT
jgi:hypothetical protein